MSKVASMDAMAALHSKLAEVLTDALAPTVTEEGGTVAPPAAILAVARQFLKDNGVEAQMVPESPLTNLANTLPDFDEGEDEGDMPDYS